MSKKSPIIAFLLLFVTFLSATPVTSDMVREVVHTHLELHSKYDLQANDSESQDDEGDYQIRRVSPLLDNEGRIVLGYIVELDPVGYVAISADTRIRPIIAYSFNRDFRFEETRTNIMLNMFRGDLELRFEALPKTSGDVILSNTEEWEDYLSGGDGLVPLFSSMTVYGPWLDTNWGQGYPYNMRCPIDPETGYRCITGCTATAMAMIHNYWEYPPFVAFAEDESYYSGYTSPPIFIDAPTASDDSIEYNYAGSEYPSNSEMANLMWASGVSVGSWYSSSGTGANVSADDYIEKWGYGNEAVELSGDHPGFYDYLSTDMIEGRPAQLSIYQSGWTGGHSINCDGYNNATNRYHLNMGWEGSSNGWYSLPTGMPAGYSIISSAVMNLLPEPRPDAPDICADAMPIYPNEDGTVYKDAIYRPGEEDWFSFEAVPESSYIFYTRGSTNTFGAIYDACVGELIDSSTAGVSRYNFFLQFIPSEAGTYVLEIRGIDDWEFGLYSFHYRTGEGPSITVTRPSAGEVLTEGTNQVVQWYSGGVPDFTTARLDYSLTGPDGPWETITDSTNYTFHIWEVPYVTEEENDVYIRVGSVEYTAILEEIGPLTILDVTGIEEKPTSPDEMSVGIFPNPFNSSMAINAPAGSDIQIYDIYGALVDDLGETEIWRPSDDAETGIYFVIINSNGRKVVHRVLYIK